MKNLFFLFILILFISSCENQITIIPNKTSSHKYLQNTNAFIVPPDKADRAQLYIGFQEEDYPRWSVSFRYSDKTLDEFQQVYAESNLKKLKKELQESKTVSYDADKKGLWFKFLDERKNKIRYFLAIDLGEKRVVLKGYIYEDYEDQFDEVIRNSLTSIYIASEKEMKEGEEELKIENEKDIANSFKVDESNFQFAGVFNNRLVYSKDGKYPTTSPDSAIIFLNQPQWNVSPSGYKQAVFEPFLGKGYKIESEEKHKGGWLSSSEAWIASSQDGKKTGYIGYVLQNFVFLFKASCTDNKEENIKLFRDFIKSVKIHSESTIRL